MPGPPEFAATRINLARSCSGIGWLLGPIAGGRFFYGTDASGASTGAQTLWIPYAGVAAVVIVLAVVFSGACVFLSYFFMSIMFPTIFALGIHGLGARAKRASAYIVMAIMGGAILPKVMGAVGDAYGLSRSFIVPLGCFAFVAFYGSAWPKLSHVETPGGAR